MFGAGEIIHPQVVVEPDRTSLGKLLEGLPAPFDLHLSIDRPDKDPRICRPSDHDLQMPMYGGISVVLRGCGLFNSQTNLVGSRGASKCGWHGRLDGISSLMCLIWRGGCVVVSRDHRGFFDDIAQRRMRRCVL